MTTPTDIEVIGSGKATGSLARGLHKKVIQSVGAATRTLLASESGSLCIFDRAAGLTYTLPTAVEGMTFDFLATVLQTGGVYSTRAATGAFLLGAVVSGELGALMDVFQANGSTHLGIATNATTTGGLVGTTWTVTAISATQWAITGQTITTNAGADPFVTV